MLRVARTVVCCHSTGVWRMRCFLSCNGWGFIPYYISRWLDWGTYGCTVGRLSRTYPIPHHMNESYMYLLFFFYNIKTNKSAELCALSEYRIYPGNGKLFIRRDGKPIWLGSSKAESLTVQRKKAAKLVWTQAWRRLHKKGLSETTQKKKSRRTGKVQRAVVGASLEDIRKKAAQKSEIRTAQKEAALKELKERKAKASSKGKAASKGKTAGPKGTFQKVPKHMGGKGKRGGSQR